MSKQTAIGGTLNVLQQAVNMKINKMVVTGSWGATLDRLWLSHFFDFLYWTSKPTAAMKRGFDGKPVTEQGPYIQSPPISHWIGTMTDWGDATEEDILSGKFGSTWEYMASKILAEKATWKFAEENPSIDVTTSRFKVLQIPWTKSANSLRSKSTLHIWSFRSPLSSSRDIQSRQQSYDVLLAYG